MMNKIKTSKRRFAHQAQGPEFFFFSNMGWDSRTGTKGTE